MSEVSGRSDSEPVRVKLASREAAPSVNGHTPVESEAVPAQAEPLDSPVRKPAGEGSEKTTARLRSLLLGTDGRDSLLSELARWTAGQVEDAISCGITVSTTIGTPMIGASSDELAKRMDAIQYVLDDGPCLTSIRDRVVVRISDVQADRRWLEFAVRGQREGVASSLSVPMVVGSRVLGAVNLYSRVCDGLDEGSLGRARQVAHQAGGAIALAVRLSQGSDGTEHAKPSTGPQSVIDQAVGIIMARQQIGPQAAFDILRTQSYHAHAEVQDRAGAVIAEVMPTTP